MYRELPVIVPPEADTAVKLLQLPSGIGVLPSRALRVSVVPAGWSAIHVIVLHGATPPASSTRDVNTAAALYGLRCIQSRTRCVPVDPVVMWSAQPTPANE